MNLPGGFLSHLGWRWPKWRWACLLAGTVSGTANPHAHPGPARASSWLLESRLRPGPCTSLPHASSSLAPKGGPAGGRAPREFFLGTSGARPFKTFKTGRRVHCGGVRPFRPTGPPQKARAHSTRPNFPRHRQKDHAAGPRAIAMPWNFGAAAMESGLTRLKNLGGIGPLQNRRSGSGSDAPRTPPSALSAHGVMRLRASPLFV